MMHNCTANVPQRPFKQWVTQNIHTMAKLVDNKPVGDCLHSGAARMMHVHTDGRKDNASGSIRTMDRGLKTDRTD